MNMPGFLCRTLCGVVFITITWITTTKREDEGTQIVGLYAISTSDQTLAIDQVVIFDEVITNVGSGYNALSGQFVVPVSGLYRIGNTGMSQRYEVFLKMKNGTEIGRSTGAKGYQTADMEAILKLERGDIIDIRRRDIKHRRPGQTQRLNGNRLASFTGFLIAKDLV